MITTSVLTINQLKKKQKKQQFELQSFGDIGSRDICLLSNMMELHGTSLLYQC